MTYVEKFTDPRWQKKRLKILERDKFSCQICFEEEKTLHIHHLLYLNSREPWEYDDKFLVTLCKDCHEFIKPVKLKDLFAEHIIVYGCDKGMRWFLKKLPDNIFNVENSGFTSIKEMYDEYLDWVKFNKSQKDG